MELIRLAAVTVLATFALRLFVESAAAGVIGRYLSAPA
jgi:predicted thioesterase